jgi:hypothetical protein
MKRTLIIVGSVALLMFLIVRMIVIGARRGDKLEQEFVSKLDYDLSAHVDSVGLFNEHAPVGFLYVTVTRGQFQNNEKKIGRSLSKSRKFRFLVPKENQLEIFSQVAREQQAGDSLVINSSQDKMITYRNGTQVAESSISDNLRGHNHD